MAMQPFVWGPGGQPISASQVAQYRKIADALASQGQPHNMWEGISNAVGDIGGALLDVKASEAEKAGQSQVAEAMKAAIANGADPKALLGVMGDSFATPQQSAVAQALLQRDWAHQDQQAQWSHEADVQGQQFSHEDKNLNQQHDWQVNDPLRQQQVETATIQNDQLKKGYRSLITPEERAAAGIDPTDTASYQAGPDGKVEPVLGKGAGITINTGEGSSAYNKALDEAQAKRYLDFQKQGEAGQSALNSAQAMAAAMSDPNFYSGAGGDQVLSLKRLAVSFGMNPEGVSSMETFNALSKQAALDVMGGSLGTGFSNADRDFVVGQVANLGNTPEGNKKLIELQTKLAQRKVEIAALATEYAKTHGQLDEGFDTELRKYAEDHPVFPKDNKGSDTSNKNAPAPPKPGEVVDGYEYIGGDPGDPASWKKADGKPTAKPADMAAPGTMITPQMLSTAPGMKAF